MTSRANFSASAGSFHWPATEQITVRASRRIRGGTYDRPSSVSSPVSVWRASGGKTWEGEEAQSHYGRHFCGGKCSSYGLLEKKQTLCLLMTTRSSPRRPWARLEPPSDDRSFFIVCWARFRTRHTRHRSTATVARWYILKKELEICVLRVLRLTSWLYRKTRKIK